LFCDANNEETGQEKPTIRSYAHEVPDNDDDAVTYEAEFDVPAGFGAVGAVLVTNENRYTELYLVDVKLSSSTDGGDNDGAVLATTIRCNSWVQPNSGDRVFFANKVR
jgi:lipoxygenase